jgi:hypothetical protein
MGLNYVYSVCSLFFSTLKERRLYLYAVESAYAVHRAHCFAHINGIDV